MDEPFKFFTTVRVRFNETDAQGHVNFGHYLFYFDAALTDYLRSIGYSYQHMLADGVDMLYAGARTRYLSPAYFDEVLNIHVRIGHIGNSSVRFEFQVFAERDRRAVADGEITVVMVAHGERRKIPVPARLRQAAGRFEGGDPIGAPVSRRAPNARLGEEPSLYPMKPYGFCGG